MSTDGSGQVVTFPYSNELPAQVVVLNQTVIAPLNRNSTPMNVMGGICNEELDKHFHQMRYGYDDSNNKELQLATSMDFVRSRVPNNVVPGTFLYGGPIFKSFGHFISESIHRLWAYQYYVNQTFTSFDAVLFIPERPRRLDVFNRLFYSLPKIYLEVLMYLGIPQTKIECQFKEKCYETIVVPEQASFFRSDIPINDGYRSFLLRCEEKSHLNGLYGTKKIYVSRKYFSKRGAYAGETYLESVFEKAGYEVFYPEKRTLMEQLITYKTAGKIVFAEGSALHVIELLGSLNADVHVLCRRPSAVKTFSTILNARVKSFSFCSSVKVLPSLYFTSKSNKAASGSSLGVFNSKKLQEYLINSVGIDEPLFCLKKFRANVEQDIRGYYLYYENKTLGEKSAKKKALSAFCVAVSNLDDVSV